MKNIVRAFVVALVLTGAVASAHTKNTTVAMKTGASPIPMCPPDDPNGCGIDGMQ
jgi:hypothetical protein